MDYSLNSCSVNIGCPTVLLPAKVVQALNLSFDMVNNGHSHPLLSNGFAPDHGKSFFLVEFLRFNSQFWGDFLLYL